MEIIKQMMDSINYMEENLLENITFKEVAESIHMSSFLYHRTFKIFTGFTPNEYIRNRRLSCASEELYFTKKTILDIALKYQYDSLEGFSKAFTRFHGFSPSKMKKGIHQINVFNPLKINVTFEGGETMKYRLVTLEPFTLLLKKEQFYVDAEENLIPEFWNQQREDGLFETLDTYAKTPSIYGACHQVDSKSKAFDYGIGVQVEKNVKVDGLDTWQIDNPLWAVFECKSAEEIGEAWDYIVKDFLVNTKLERVDTLDFELYPDNRDDIFCELYIPVKRRD